jgi:hypothetical protein
MLTMFRALTSDNWNGLLYDCSITTLCTKVLQDYPNGTIDNGGIALAVGDYYSDSDLELMGVPSEHLKNECSISPLVATIFFFRYLLFSFV